MADGARLDLLELQKEQKPNQRFSTAARAPGCPARLQASPHI